MTRNYGILRIEVQADLVEFIARRILKEIDQAVRVGHPSHVARVYRLTGHSAEIEAPAEVLTEVQGWFKSSPLVTTELVA